MTVAKRREYWSKRATVQGSNCMKSKGIQSTQIGAQVQEIFNETQQASTEEPEGVQNTGTRD